MTTSTMIRAARYNVRAWWTWSIFLVLGASLTVASPVVSPVDSGEARVANLRRAWEDCTTLVHEKPCAPIIVRLAWHEAGTYDAKLKNGGAIGTIIYPSELRHPNDAGLDGAVELLRPLHAANPEVSWAVSLLLLLAVVLASDLALLLAGGTGPALGRSGEVFRQGRPPGHPEVFASTEPALPLEWRELFSGGGGGRAPGGFEMDEGSGPALPLE